MSKDEQLARLALARASSRNISTVLETSDQRAAIHLLRSIAPQVVLSLAGDTGIRVHTQLWGRHTASQAA
ncbi:MAG: hypothetical protein KGL39_46000 [Patescibacteria group bacterium]|nr:hypothetical protein [Patescibacteria group bacterium]